MPSPGDRIQVTLVWDLAGRSKALNVFKMELQSVSVDDWSAVADDLEDFFPLLYNDWLDNVATNIVSESFAIALRNQVTSEWDTVLERDYIALVGDAIGGTTQSPNAGSVTAYPESIRHWGSKRLPPPSEGAISDGVLTAQALLDLLIFGAGWVATYNGVNNVWLNGVFSEATNQFRRFTGSFLATDVCGTQVTRKVGRGV